MRIVVAGASGMIGSALVRALRAAGHEVRTLVRRTAAGPDEIAWDPAGAGIDAAQLTGVEAIVNLAGENVAGGRWNEARRERILRSRVDPTRTLVVAMLQLPRKPKVFLSASAVGYYGECGDTEVNERSAIGHGFLPEVCLAWETHAEGAARGGGVRTVLLRFGVVLAREGGALAKMLPFFRAGLGGRMGRGRQWMSWIALDDAVGAILTVLENRKVSGPVNVVAPHPATNARFALTLARVLNRPMLLPAPAWALRLVFGQMADETVLLSTKALPMALGRAGYEFRHPELEGALRAVLGRSGL